MFKTTSVLISIVAVFSVFHAVTLHAGKLASVRQKAKANTDAKKDNKESKKSASTKRQRTPQESKPKRSIAKVRSRTNKTKVAASNRQASSSVPRQNSTSKRHNTTSRPKKESTQGSPKLAQIRSQVRQPTPRRNRTNSPKQSGTNHKHVHRHHHGRHHRRSPHSFGIHFFQDPTPSYPTVIHQEHYFVDQPVVYQAPEWDSGSLTVPPEPTPLAPIESSPLGGYPNEALLTPIPNNCVPDANRMEILDPWHTKFAIRYGIDADDLSQFGFKLLANRHAGFGIDVDAGLLRESGTDFRDHLWLGDCNIVYELFPSNRFRPRAGVGVAWLADRFGSEAGLNLTVGAEMSITPNLYVATEVDFGTLGDADFFHALATIGILQHETVEWFVGYDHLDIGGIEIKSVIGGLRFHF